MVRSGARLAEPCAVHRPLMRQPVAGNLRSYFNKEAIARQTGLLRRYRRTERVDTTVIPCTLSYATVIHISQASRSTHRRAQSTCSRIDPPMDGRNAYQSRSCHTQQQAIRQRFGLQQGTLAGGSTYPDCAMKRCAAQPGYPHHNAMAVRTHCLLSLGPQASPAHVDRTLSENEPGVNTDRLQKGTCRSTKRRPCMPVPPL